MPSKRKDGAGGKHPHPPRPRDGAPSERYRNVLEYITPEFVEEGARKVRREDVRDVACRGAEIRRQFEEGGVLDRFRAEALTLHDLLHDYDRGRYVEAPLWTVAVGTFVLQYLLKPVDIIPDSLPVVGQLDDALVLSQGLVLVRRDLHAFKVWKLATAALLD